MIIDDEMMEKGDAITIDDVEVEDILQFALEEKREKVKNNCASNMMSHLKNVVMFMMK